MKDDGPFSNLDVDWDYLFGEALVFEDFGRNEETTHQGVMSSTLKAIRTPIPEWCWSRFVKTMSLDIPVVLMGPMHQPVFHSN